MEIDFTILFVAILTLTISGLLWWHYIVRKMAIQLHSQIKEELHETIEQHKSQLFCRAQNLNNYNFLIHNLEQALIIQPEITLKYD
ncbi:hypothetical protein [Aequorivita sediminis]|uniref:hypothetical protein n=1 Tax=Aequorivita sediminis TaxID=3073653 RepID=UPI0028A611EB|nr:hypothetical protein [Aequorivita sp. F6058]